MKSIPISGLSRPVSCIGMGSAKFDPDESDQIARLLDAYREAGGNLIDSAELYGDGRSEQAVGQYLHGRGARSQWVILTKTASNPKLVRPDYICHAVFRSLERLQTDYIDLYVLHRDDPSVPVGELVDALCSLRDAGRIGAYGLSNWSTARIDEAFRYARSRSLTEPSLSSPHLGLATPKEPTWEGCTHATAEDMKWYADHDLAVFGWSSQCRGFFAKESGPQQTSIPDLVRVYHSADNFEKLERTRKLAKSKGIEPVQVALAWVLHQQAPTVALVGPRDVEELRVAIEAAEVELTPEEVAWLELH